MIAHRQDLVEAMGMSEEALVVRAAKAALFHPANSGSATTVRLFLE
jgi:hypothetical protein